MTQKSRRHLLRFLVPLFLGFAIHGALAGEIDLGAGRASLESTVGGLPQPITLPPSAAADPSPENLSPRPAEQADLTVSPEPGFFSFKDQPMREEDRVSLTVMGYRFDDQTGRVLSPETKKPVSAAEMSKLRGKLRGGRMFAALERLWSSKDKEAEAILRDQKDVVPADVTRAAAEGRGPFREAILRRLSSLALRAFEKEAKKSPKELAKPPPSYFDEREERLGELLQRQLVSELEKDAEGRKLLDELKGPDGKPRLPRMGIQKIYSSAFAMYSDRSEMMRIDSGRVRNFVRQELSFKERSASEAQMKTESGLADYLLGHPQILSRFIAYSASSLFHELVHHHQRLTWPLVQAQLDGLVPGYESMEREHEAYFRESLYFHSKWMKDPETSDFQGRGWHRDFIDKSLGDWFSYFVRDYSKSWPVGVVPEVKALAAIHDRTAALVRRLLQNDPRAAAVVGLEDLKRGKEILSQEHDRLFALNQRIGETHPRLRWEAWRRQAQLDASKGEWIFVQEALQKLMGALPEAESRPEAEGQIAETAVQALRLLAGQKVVIDESFVNLMSGFYDQMQKPWPKELWALRRSVFSHWARACRNLARAKSSSNLRTAAEERSGYRARAKHFETLIRQDAAQLRKFRGERF